MYVFDFIKFFYYIKKIKDFLRLIVTCLAGFNVFGTQLHRN